MNIEWFSLHRRLSILVLGGLSICWVWMLLWSYSDTHHEVNELLDGQLLVEAHTLLALAAHETEEMLDTNKDRDEAQEHERLENLRFQIWTSDGQLVLNSPNTPKAPLTQTVGFSDTVEGLGESLRWRYYLQWANDRTVWVIVGVNHHVRDELITHTVWRLLAPALCGLPILALWVWLAIRHGLRPLNDVADQIRAREPQHLTAVEPATAPIEIRPLIESINHVFTRVEKTIESEKRFTADAAHELRTPLAALAAQAQVALRARDANERRHAIDQLIASSRRASRLVDQLLTLAKVDPEDIASPCCVFLDRVAEEVCAQHGAVAIANNVTLELDAAPTVINGDADMIGILLRNLIDNAIRYTPAGGRVLVSVRDLCVTVEDSGPGIPEAERARVFDRFHRLAGQEKEGSGLGLSIVARIAERHGAAIQLGTGANGTGLKVTIEFRP